MPAAAAPAAEAPSAVADADKKKAICRNERPIGSNRVQRVCRMRQQIDMESELYRDGMVEIGRRRDSASGRSSAF
ncbi:MAG TPA: hypothetical protein VFE72_05675 [Lysobacter sp.]|nr:hypothetical protein [Lysobacter sp.]